MLLRLGIIEVVGHLGSDNEIEGAVHKGEAESGAGDVSPGSVQAEHHRVYIQVGESPVPSMPAGPFLKKLPQEPVAGSEVKDLEVMYGTIPKQAGDGGFKGLREVEQSVDLVERAVKFPEFGFGTNRVEIFCLRAALAEKHSVPDIMHEAQLKAPLRFVVFGKIMLRLMMAGMVVLLVGLVLQRIERSLETAGKPAGFSRGLLQGALMPMALPNLAVGSDVTIYAPNNTGRTYKLGYTAGVNVCGLIVFGAFFWRLSRMRRRSIA